MESIALIVNNQREYFNSAVTLDLEFRIESLKKLKKAIVDNEKDILEALKKDLNKAPLEGYAAEIGITLEEINFTIKNLKKWMKPKRVRTPITQFPSVSRIYSDPYGVVLIMSPWNYPFQLSITPLIGAIAGGNCALIKPSEYSSNTSQLLEKIIGETFDNRFVSLIRGGREINSRILEERFDYIFFTGSPYVGRLVMEAASRNLTPLTLELGGKSPCIVDESADIDIAARRIVWGKFINSGQTCVAPDYIFAHKDIKSDLIGCIKKYIREFYGDNPLDSVDYPRIINKKHFDRLISLIDGDIAIGGRLREETLQIEPTLINNATFDHKAMDEEIFGPIIPLIEFSNIDNVIEKINSMEKPLALYLFTRSKNVEDKILTRVSFGGGCINDTIVHLSNPHMPFGGVGNSGMGGYHGKYSFDAFTHKKSILKKSNLFDIPLRYPPYKNKLGLLKKVMK
ncbi:MAG: aldehyde dehydrogenase [Clostridium sp.]|uniref:aldehyde dehydrogenase n=1 Tax=Clostridium sp. TaxID=1506 RepID=UPI002FCAD859